MKMNEWLFVKPGDDEPALPPERDPDFPPTKPPVPPTGTTRW